MLATLCELVHEALGERTVGVVQGTPGFQRSHQGFWDRKLFADNDGDQRFDHRAEFSDAQVHVGLVELETVKRERMLSTSSHATSDSLLNDINPFSSPTITTPPFPAS